MTATTNAERQAKWRAKHISPAEQKARAAGWDSLVEFLDAVGKGQAEIPPKPTTPQQS